MDQEPNPVADEASNKQRTEGILPRLTGQVIARLRCLFACLLCQSVSPALPADCLGALKFCSLRRGHGPCRFPRFSSTLPDWAKRCWASLYSRAAVLLPSPSFC